jgi:hypothetical protein
LAAPASNAVASAIFQHVDFSLTLREKNLLRVLSLTQPAQAKTHAGDQQIGRVFGDTLGLSSPFLVFLNKTPLLSLVVAIAPQRRSPSRRIAPTALVVFRGR